MNRLILHQHPVSQPCRSVIWALKLTGTPCETREWDPASGETRRKEFRSMNPAGTIPVLEDNGHFVFESCAILAYLANRDKSGGWDSLYPPSPLARAKVEQYLYYHQSGTRQCTTELFRPYLFATIMGKEVDLEKLRAKGTKRVNKVSKTLEKWIGPNAYITGSTLTVADLMCYCEYDQLVETGLYTLDKYPSLKNWFERMKVWCPLPSSHSPPLLAFMSCT
mmetsp:Transcript_19116/g.53659  ORF Transcript_19116/g.53659 Transcript_19116/m.53659 type:complete len:222 (+) Transcript_19116:93-758(+)